MNASTNEGLVRGVGSHDAVNGGGVDTSNVVLLNEGTELRVVADPLDNGNGEDPEKKENPMSQHPGLKH